MRYLWVVMLADLSLIILLIGVSVYGIEHW
jgi:hypothetical protein